MEAACQSARKPLAGWRLPEGMRATLTRRPFPFPFVMCPEYFFLMLFFCGYRACYCSSSSSSSFRSTPVYGFPGRSPGGAGCRERSQRSCLRPGGLPSLTQNPRLAATGTVASPLSRRGLRSWHPGKRRRDVRSNAVSQTALHVVAAGPCSLPAGCHTPV